MSNFCSVYGMVFNGLVVGVVGRALMQVRGEGGGVGVVWAGVGVWGR